MRKNSDYEIVVRAIGFLRERFREQPTLAALSQAMGVSPFHLQRVFSRWAGVSPKRFLQFLTVQEAKQRLRSSEAVLSASFASGLSGPARLHDLLLSTTAVTPGEYRKGGGSLTIHYGLSATPFGPALLGLTERGLCHLAFLDPSDLLGKEAIRALEGEWPNARLVEDPPRAEETAVVVFSPLALSQGLSKGARPPSLSLLLKGTNFQIRVWEALLRIPPGAVATYGQMARALGRPGAARAVGSAVARNPIAYLIPCHRVIREEGVLGGYRWGPSRKKAILGWEAAKTTS
jgi:AraC family transcriptional regulator of adaptative response/methylated-DNA-[protein]-cysteine methyltransferase